MDATEDRSHANLVIKMLPDSLIALREELAHHQDISDYASQGRDFGDCLGRIGTKLDIALDGDYDVDSLSEILLSALRGRRFGHHPEYTRKRLGLVPAELVERAGELSLETQKNTIYGSSEMIVTEVDTTMPQAPEQLPAVAPKEDLGDGVWADVDPDTVAKG